MYQPFIVIILKNEFAVVYYNYPKKARSTEVKNYLLKTDRGIS